MIEFLQDHKSQIIGSLILLSVFVLISLVGSFLIRRIGKRSSINQARVNLMVRYSNVTLLLILALLLSFVFGVQWEDIGVVFSSIFAILGIALFAIWSILSNVTSGIIMFFSFPYKVGDKIEIHDKDFPIQAIIEDIRAFHLHLRIENGDLITYPNNLILQKAVTLLKKDAIEELDQK